MRYQVRVCAVGTPAELSRLMRELYENAMDPDEEEIPAPEKLQAELERISRDQGGEGDQFLYEMICQRPWGDALPGSCRMTREAAPGGLETLLFTYTSPNRFQAHDWLQLHKSTGRPLIVALYAAEDFTQDKGEVVFAGGGSMDNWDHLDACWLWLTGRYGAALDDAELPGWLLQLAETLREEEYDADVPELLAECGENLTHLAEQLANPEEMAERMRQALAEGAFGQLLACRHAIAEGRLWDTEHLSRWQDALARTRAAWEALI